MGLQLQLRHVLTLSCGQSIHVGAQLKYSSQRFPVAFAYLTVLGKQNIVHVHDISVLLSKIAFAVSLGSI